MTRRVTRIAANDSGVATKASPPAHGDEQACDAAETAMDLRLPVAVPLMLQPVQDAGPASGRRVRRVFDAGNRELLPGKLVLEERRPDLTSDVHALEAFRACGATYDFLAKAFLRNSIDNRGMAIESSVHFGKRYANACWNGRQMIFGDGDGRLFGRFTGAIDVVAHELMHGVVQHSARLAYAGQSGAVSEHLGRRIALTRPRRNPCRIT
jgi:Zn-dependent metalloprotease